MSSNIKNILIFGGVAIALVLVYVFFLKPAAPEENLVSSDGTPAVTSTGNSGSSSTLLSDDFLSILLNVKSIKLDTSIFTDSSFLSLHDSSIVLVPEGNEGRPNPFAPIGVDVAGGMPANALNAAFTPSIVTPLQTPPAPIVPSLKP